MPPSSLLARLKATTTECSSGNDAASTQSRLSSLGRAAASNTNNANGISSSSRPQTDTGGRASSLAAAATLKGSTISAPSSLGRRIERYVLSVGDDKCANSDVVDESMAKSMSSLTLSTAAATTTTRPLKGEQSIIAHAPNDNDTSSATKDSTFNAIQTTPIVKTKLTTLQHLSTHQQLRDDDVFNSIPPYYMCSQSEAYDRAQYSELSPFEYSYTSLRLQHQQQNQIYRKNEVVELQRRYSHDNRPTFDPHRIVKKYRRSAAGGGTLLDNTSTNDDHGYRSLDMLKTTVNYLLNYIFVHQRPPPPSSLDNDNSTNDAGDPNEISIWGEEEDENDNNDNGPLFSLAETVSFIDDRLRAVQKDLVTLLGNHPAQDTINRYHRQQHQQQQQLVFEAKRSARKMQACMVRYNILASYLLSDLPLEKYEKTFGVRALRTAMASYRELSGELYEDYHPDEGEVVLGDESIEQRRWRLRRQREQKERSASYKMEIRTRDEIMAYAAILHSSAVLYSEERTLYAISSGEGGVGGGGAAMSSLMEDGGSGWGALLLMMSSSFSRTQRVYDQGAFGVEKDESEEYPRWKWALELASAAQNGNYQRYFALLEAGPVALDAATTAKGHQEENGDAHSDHSRFLILARCCASHSLNLVRLGQLRRYNHAFGKGEAVSAMDIARLLRLGTCIPTTNDKGDEGGTVKDAIKWAIDFCCDAGLPIVEMEGGKTGKSTMYALMKSAPITVKSEDSICRMCNPGRMNDSFVFGSKLYHVDRARMSCPSNQSAVVMTRQSDSIREDGVDDWEDRDDGEDDAKISDEASVSMSTFACEARSDEDGVLIPPCHVLRILIE
ncbi:hypothetical protein ACHAWU_009401 [Discostella pseudostelligera]|uniref:Nuclear pore protein n=1 Tax=Discostella pseudostelligera TaxID=259834 RepID=A0ABD3LWI5_9STRA